MRVHKHMHAEAVLPLQSTFQELRPIHFWIWKKKCVGSVLPQAEAERPPRARGTWSGVGRRGAELPTPLCLRSSASSSYLYLALVSVPGSVSPGAPAAVFVSPSSPGSPCSFSASEWAALTPTTHRRPRFVLKRPFAWGGE